MIAHCSPSLRALAPSNEGDALQTRRHLRVPASLLATRCAPLVQLVQTRSRFWKSHRKRSAPAPVCQTSNCYGAVIGRAEVGGVWLCRGFISTVHVLGQLVSTRRSITPSRLIAEIITTPPAHRITATTLTRKQITRCGSRVASGSRPSRWRV
jgi:hypothetical protein